MAISIDTGKYEAPQRSDVYTIDPRIIEVDWAKNISRGGVRPPVDDDLKALARDMMPKTGPGDSEKGSSGQLNPILVRLLSDRKLEIVGGFRRLAAALWLIESKTCKDFKIKVIRVKMSDAEAAIANIQENMQRQDPSPVQLAHAVRCLHEDYGMPMATIAARLKRSVGYITQLVELTGLPSDIQASVEKGETTVTAGIELSKLDGKAQRAVFNEAKTTGGKRVSAAQVKSTHRKKVEATGKSTGKARTVGELRAFLETKTAANEDADGRKFANALLDYLDGTKTEEQMHRHWDKLFPTPEQAVA